LNTSGARMRVVRSSWFLVMVNSCHRGYADCWFEFQGGAENRLRRTPASSRCRRAASVSIRIDAAPRMPEGCGDFIAESRGGG